MKDFALKLEGCSKADRKKVIKAAKSVGLSWWDDDRFNDGRFGYLWIKRDLTYIEKDCLRDNRVIYQMPEDWEKIQEALGIEVEVKKLHEYKVNFNDMPKIKVILQREYDELKERVKELEEKNCYQAMKKAELEEENEKLKELNTYQGVRIEEIENKNANLYKMADEARKENRRLFKKTLNI